MVPLLLGVIATCGVVSNSYSQALEGGFLLGGSLYSGDLDPDEFAEYLGNFRPAIGLFFRYQVNDRIGARLGYQFAQVVGDHADAQDPRNLSFRSNISEVSLLGEFNILPFGLDAGRIAPFVMGGGAFFHFNPTTDFQGSLVKLQPLGTEGQTLPGGPGVYSLNQFAWIVGGGLRYLVRDNLVLGVEAGFRGTFTDFLDDVSGVYANNDDLATQISNLSAMLADRSATPNPPGALRGNAAVNDTYIIVQLSISYILDGLSFGQGGGRNRLGCPTF